MKSEHAERPLKRQSRAHASAAVSVLVRGRVEGGRRSDLKPSLGARASNGGAYTIAIKSYRNYKHVKRKLKQCSRNFASSRQALSVSLSDPRITSLPAARSLSVSELLDIMRIDKKNSGPQKKIVMLSRIGKTYGEKATAVADAVIAKALSESVKLVPAFPSKSPVRMATPGSKSDLAAVHRPIAMMKTFGIVVERVKDTDTGKLLDVYRIPKGVYQNLAEYNIESDASSATYPLTIAAITGATCAFTNIGSAYLQADARFAKEVLEPMGCKVVQTETETTVTGPPIGQRAIGLVDMEPTTDAFLTASVLAAVASLPPTEERTLRDGSRPTTTCIIGIANQRVKECNRIKAIIDELVGVETLELSDVYGEPLSELKEGASVHCYDDRRVAMTFSVLGSVVKDTVIEEKRCVEKTWLNWWDDLDNKIGLEVEGVEIPSVHGLASASRPTAEDSYASVILIGMRGTGKTFVGELAASSLAWQFIDANATFEQKHAIGVREFVQKNGWPAFRTAETKVLQELLAQNAQGHVISLGGGIVETPAARDLLKLYAKKGPVVHIVREIDEVITYLGEETARPAYGEPITIIDVFKRRAPWFAECCSYEFINHTGPLNALDDDSKVTPSTLSVREEVSRFFHHITGQRPNHAANLKKAGAGVDAIELRVDLLRSPKDFDKLGPYIPSSAYVSNQIAALRHKTTLPIIFTVRTVSQGGQFPNHAEKEAFELLWTAVRGVEYIDLELSWSEKSILGLIARKGHSKIIASWHDWNGDMYWTGKPVEAKYRLAHEYGDIVKIVGKANGFEDNFALHQFVSKMQAAVDAKPIIAINMGVERQMSRILNSTFSPVTHALLPTSKAALGQLSFAQIQTALHLLGQLPAQRFFLFGTPIAHSRSPTLHNTAFETLGLPHKYELLETQTVSDEIKAAPVDHPQARDRVDHRRGRHVSGGDLCLVVTGCSPSPARSECEDFIRGSETKYKGTEDEVGRGSGTNAVYWRWFV
ncbi:type I 3-dehydroquinase-domain-containing protein [Fomes fomentarius]|nr:type I 3-dehydroquinase-domain-containing protein [Fomes fomentarius]